MNLTDEQRKMRDELAKALASNWETPFQACAKGSYLLGYTDGLREAQVLVSALELIGDDEVWEKNNICPHEEAREALANFRGEK